MKLFKQIDDYFSQKSSVEKISLIVLLSLLVGYFLYVFFIDSAKSIYDKSNTKKMQLEHSISQNEAYLKNMGNGDGAEYEVSTLEGKIDALEKQKKDDKKKTELVDNNLNELSGLLFNKENWSQFLTSITTKASSNDVTIETISNRYVDNKGSFGHVLEIGIKCRGDFRGIVGFMADMEKNTLVTDIFSSDIKPNAQEGDLVADINISVWGVNH